MNRLFTITGSKSRLAKQIATTIPPHKIYAEPFAGSAQVFFALAENKRKVILNDHNRDLVNLFKTLRDHSAWIRKTLDLFEYSEENYWRCHPENEEYLAASDKMKAAMYLFRIWSSFGSGVNTGFAYSKADDFAARAINKSKLIPDIAKKLKTAHIFNRDYSFIFKKFDSKDTFFFIDPPYDSSYFQYKSSKKKIDYDSLASTIKSISGKWILSTYEGDFFEQFADYDFEEVNANLHGGLNKHTRERFQRKKEYLIYGI